MKMFRVFMTVAIMLLLGAPAWAADGDWNWVRVEPVNGQWDISKGVGSLRIEGRKFKADLKVDRDAREGADMHVEGRIAGDRVIATVKYLNTDAVPETFHGTIKTAPQWGTEQITLIGARAGAFIGLTRGAQLHP